MRFTRATIFQGCLLASIAHAIMTNVYPELSHEQSWDGKNYSIQDSSGIRGTITFEADYCIGAIRNENSDFIAGSECIEKYMKCFPPNIIQKAHEETLQYLLLEEAGSITPYVSSIFWADDRTVHFEKKYANCIKRDLVLLQNILLPERKAVRAWKEYYDMDSESIELLYNLYEIKLHDFYETFFLTEKQKQYIPGNFINDTCVESLRELNIFIYKTD